MLHLLWTYHRNYFYKDRCLIDTCDCWSSTLPCCRNTVGWGVYMIRWHFDSVAGAQNVTRILHILGLLQNVLSAFSTSGIKSTCDLMLSLLGSTDVVRIVSFAHLCLTLVADGWEHLIYIYILIYIYTSQGCCAIMWSTCIFRICLSEAIWSYFSWIWNLCQQLLCKEIYVMTSDIAFSEKYFYGKFPEIFCWIGKM